MRQPKETKMMKAPTETKMVRAKVNYPIRLVREGIPTEYREGATVELTESEAKEFCDTLYTGHHKFTGERFEEDGQVFRHEVRRCERIKD